MAQITLGGNPIHTNGEAPGGVVGQAAPAARLVTTALQLVDLDAFAGVKVLNIFPSVDTGVCATSVRTFNEQAGALEGVTVLNISADLPFAHKRFCGAEGLEGVVSLSTFRGSFAQDYGVQITDGPMAGLCARAVVVVDAEGTIRYQELVPEIGQEPDYASALAAAQAA